MENIRQIAADHADLTRRYFLKLSAASAAAMSASQLLAAETPDKSLLEEATAKLQYLTNDEDFATYGRGKPQPHKLPPERLREVGLNRDTWWCEITADPESNSRVDNPLTREKGNALNFTTLMKIAETKTVRFMGVMSCTNGKSPCGMGLWEGIPLREVIWMAKPASNVRRVFYYGYHNDDPAQRFRSSLPIGRVLEDPPGLHPITLCYKLNGRWLSPDRGGPVRILVPEEYGNKCVKWIQHIILTNTPQSNDTYAEWNNDTVSHLKTCARFIHTPTTMSAGQPAPVTGLAQVGMSGLSKVQYWLAPTDENLPDDDPYFESAPWKDADILPAPEKFSPPLADNKLPEIPTQFDTRTGKPRTWPMPYTIAHWATLIQADKSGEYTLRCRTIDNNGTAQPMPRPFLKSGHNAIQAVKITVS